MLPLYYRKFLDSGMFAGLINSFFYIGSMISTYGLGTVIDGAGWNAYFIVLLSVSVITILASATASACAAQIKKKEPGLASV